MTQSVLSQKVAHAEACLASAYHNNIEVEIGHQIPPILFPFPTKIASDTEFALCNSYVGERIEASFVPAFISQCHTLIHPTMADAAMARGIGSGVKEEVDNWVCAHRDCTWSPNPGVRRETDSSGPLIETCTKLRCEKFSFGEKAILGRPFHLLFFRDYHEAVVPYALRDFSS